MSATLLPNAEQQFVDGNGKPLAGGSVYFYIPNTSTPKATWQDSGQTILNTNPVVLDGAGRAAIWGAGIYRQVVYDQFNNLIWDKVTEDTSGGLLGVMTDNTYLSGSDFTPGTTTSLTISSQPGSKANTWVYFDGVYQTPDTYSLSLSTITFTSAIPVGVAKVNIKVGSTVATGVPGAGTVYDVNVASNAAIKSSKLSFQGSPTGTVPVSLQTKLNDFLTVKDFGAKGDGVTDDSAAFQAAINTGVCRIPYSSLGYLINTPLNATNLTSLTIEGVVPLQAAWGLGYVNPMGGSIIYGNTGGWVLDITGSNNVLLKNFTISCLPQFLNAALPNLTNPSIAGIVGGTSNANPTGLNYPGGMGYIFENISVWIGKNGSSVPIYINNGNIGRYTNVATLGQYGICLVGGNPLSATPPYATFGPVTQSDTNIISGAFCAGYGNNPVMYFEQCNDLQLLESYNTFAGGLNGGPYSGVGYSLYLNNCSNIKIKLGVDSFPYMFRMDGAISFVDMEGLISQGSTATPIGNPAVGFINASSIKYCKFKVYQFDNRPNNNYLYLTASGILNSMIGCDFWIDNSETSNVIFFNATNANAVPYYNLNFTGNQDFSVGTTAMTLQVNGSPAAMSNYRINMNGNRQGSA